MKKDVNQEDFRKENLLHLLETNTEALADLIEKISTRRFYVGETSLTRKTFLMWIRSGIMPYSFEKNKWSQLSFIEYCWLQCVIELRNIGISLDRIKKLKEELFDLSNSILASSLKEMALTYQGHVNQKGRVLGIYKNPALNSKTLKKAFEKIQISKFSIYLIQTLSKDENTCLIFSSDETSKFIVFGTTDEELNAANSKMLIQIKDQSFVCVNIRNIIHSLLFKDDSKRNDDLIIDFLSKNEKEILNQIKSKNVKKITIRFSDDSKPTHIEIEKNGITEEIINKVGRFLKKGKFQIIEFRTRDGKIISYNETDIKKLDS